MKIFYKTVLLIAFVLSIVKCNCDNDNINISDVMRDNEIVSDVIDVAPEHLLKVSYLSNVKANAGNELTPTQVKDIPTVEWESESDSYYTLILTDPDAPSRAAPASREFVHWIVVNIPGSDLSAGETIYGYVGSGPPNGTGLHRYVFLLYKQSSIATFDEPKVSNRSAENRRLFSAKNFALKHNLGNPIYGNFYQAQYDDYVPTVHKQLGVSK